MSDHDIVYDERFGMRTFKRVLSNELGQEAWGRLMDGLDLPDIDAGEEFSSENMQIFIERLNNLVDDKTANQVLSKVRHGLKPSQCSWAREKFLEIGDLDQFIQAQYEDTLANFSKLNAEGKDFYGDPITDEVLAFIIENKSMLSGIRTGNKLLCRAFPANMSKYLQATDHRMKRYYACHCPYAKESILSDKTVSSTLCYCSLGHMMNFWEAVFDQKLEGNVVSSVLAGDLYCEYEIEIPTEVIKKYVKSDQGGL